jgi:hypothetical protein
MDRSNRLESRSRGRRDLKERKVNQNKITIVLFKNLIAVLWQVLEPIVRAMHDSGMHVIGMPLCKMCLGCILIFVLGPNFLE